MAEHIIEWTDLPCLQRWKIFAGTNLVPFQEASLILSKPNDDAEQIRLDLVRFSFAVENNTSHLFCLASSRLLSGLRRKTCHGTDRQAEHSSRSWYRYGNLGY